MNVVYLASKWGVIAECARKSLNRLEPVPNLINQIRSCRQTNPNPVLKERNQHYDLAWGITRRYRYITLDVLTALFEHFGAVMYEEVLFELDGCSNTTQDHAAIILQQGCSNKTASPSQFIEILNMLKVSSTCMEHLKTIKSNDVEQKVTMQDMKEIFVGLNDLQPTELA